ncbi:helix-turn-helix domain-containing protein [Rubinisphaera margarita]|uniref:helix-turn-helix domain-containing protein n=1 Tax=Rubinisphaera margarita TaxID=2909586 RepID=UPI001EE90C15|nr:helix-turn-helix transcriptional regulator [Rubinisphaera margarita]MCG6157552.1 helix-turn-helix domain-containing protein [Rubinisphaera margarita]
MEDNKAGQSQTDPDRLLWSRIERYCVEHGWTISRLAEESGVSRATLHQWQQKGRCKPRNTTLYKLANALSVSPAVLKSEAAGTEVRAPEPLLDNSWNPLWPPLPGELMSADLQREFDRQTNGTIEDVCRERPELFAGWSENEWDELFSTFGVGGELNEDGVRMQAEFINRKRETLYQVQILLETHLADAARAVIQSLYDSVQCATDDAAQQ